MKSRKRVIVLSSRKGKSLQKSCSRLETQATEQTWPVIHKVMASSSLSSLG